MAVGRALLAALLALAASGAAAGPVVISKAPDSVSVTVYRDPQRWRGSGIDPEADMLNGFALVTETRTVDLPAGPVTVRFEGVASGIQPETALLAGIDTREKNQDRSLLSQRALVDAFTGQRATLRRTDKRTGRVVEQPALIRSAANGIVVQTAAGFEALHCTGLNETLLYPHVPAGVSAKPVLSVMSGNHVAGPRTLTLSYLTGNFDWQADYVGELSPDGRTLSLFAWLTLASRDDTSFVHAQANAVAGKLAKVDRDDAMPRGEQETEVVAHCWPSSAVLPSAAVPPPPPPSPGGYVTAEGAQEIVVTGTRIARQEALGDLKLYRIPFAVTVAARSQKQVAFLSKPRVTGELLYRSEVSSGRDPENPRLLYRFRNRKEEGAGDPLPAGKVALFQNVGGSRLLLGETAIEDKAVGEEVELQLPDATNVVVKSEESDRGKHWTAQQLTVSNANPFPILYEARFQDDADSRFGRFSGKVLRENGRSIWRVRVPANGRAVFSFREDRLDD